MQLNNIEHTCIRNDYRLSIYMVYLIYCSIKLVPNCLHSGKSICIVSFSNTPYNVLNTNASNLKLGIVA